MIILVSSKISQNNIIESLGKPEYSYYFLLREFLPALEQIGTLIQINSLDEVDTLYDKYTAAGENVIFLSVSPPQQTPVHLRCPTVCLFAWEFNKIPDTPWENEPRNEWKYVLERIAGAIACSEESAQAVREVMGEDYPIIGLPAPVFSRFKDLKPETGWLPQNERTFEFTGFVYDSPLIGLSADGLVQHMERSQPYTIRTSYDEEHADANTQFQGRLRTTWHLFKEWCSELKKFADAKPVIPTHEPVAATNTTTPAAPVATSPPTEIYSEHYHLEIKGTVYTTVLNPADHRKNWCFIISSFCWAFRDNPNATLIIKTTHHSLNFYRIELLTVLSRLAPLECRVIVLHGFLDDEQYSNLIRITDYYVNGSACEGLCLPIMEYLSAGKPVIAPCHTAMLDYISAQSSFIVNSYPEPSPWPHDPTGTFASRRFRIDWQSMHQHFKASYDIAQTQPNVYKTMSQDAWLSMYKFCHLDKVTTDLECFLKSLIVKKSTSLSEKTEVSV